LEDLEQMRKENEERLRELEQVYNRKKENSGIGKAIRQKMGYPTEDDIAPKSNRDYGEEDDEAIFIKGKKESTSYGASKGTGTFTK
jgi:hypothetical protein